nr:thiol:disulfide interchange protein DsbA/DsbL [Neisseria sp. HSC-16F19]
MKKTVWALAVGLLSVNLAHGAIKEGEDYLVLPQTIPQLQADKIEVLEFFSYTCIHCARIDPLLLQQSKRFADDTYLRTEHVVWDASMLGFARIAAAVNASGTKYEANPAIFKAVFEENANLGNPDTFKAWAAKQNSFGGKLLTAYNSPENATAAKKMQSLTEQFKVEGTPMLVVGGKYAVQLRDYEQGVRVVGELVDKVRAERNMKPAAARPVPKSIGAAAAFGANR